MSESNNKGFYILKKTIAILTAVFTVAVGACLISASLGIYRGGEGEYTRATVAEGLDSVSVPVYIWLALLAAGLACRFLAPDKADKPQRTPVSYRLKRLSLSADLSKCDIDIVKTVEIERRKRRIWTAVPATVFAIITVVYLFYALNGANYTDDISTSVAKAFAVLVACYTPFVLLIGALYFPYRHSMEREVTALQKAPKAATQAQKKLIADKAAGWVRLALLVIGAVLLTVGICMGGMADVLTKAINICTECVGLG